MQNPSLPLQSASLAIYLLQTPELYMVLAGQDHASPVESPTATSIQVYEVKLHLLVQQSISL